MVEHYPVFPERGHNKRQREETFSFLGMDIHDTVYSIFAIVSSVAGAVLALFWDRSYTDSGPIFLGPAIISASSVLTVKVLALFNT